MLPIKLTDTEIENEDQARNNACSSSYTFLKEDLKQRRVSPACPTHVLLDRVPKILLIIPFSPSSDPRKVELTEIENYLSFE